MSKLICTKLGGSLELKSVVGQGTTVEFNIEIYKEGDNSLFRSQLNSQAFNYQGESQASFEREPSNMED